MIKTSNRACEILSALYKDGFSKEEIQEVSSLLGSLHLACENHNRKKEVVVPVEKPSVIPESVRNFGDLFQKTYELLTKAHTEGWCPTTDEFCSDFKENLGFTDRAGSQLVELVRLYITHGDVVSFVSKVRDQFPAWRDLILRSVYSTLNKALEARSCPTCGACPTGSRPYSP